MAEVFDIQQQWFDSFGSLAVDGRVYYGKPNTDPTLLVNQIPVFSDRALTVATQLPNPQTIAADGRVENKPWLNQRYSIQVDDRNGVTIFSSQDNGENPSTGGILALSNVQGINAITAETPAGITEYDDQQIFTMRLVATNTGDMTVNIDTVGTQPFKFNFNEEISPGFFQANQVISFIYNSNQDNFNWIDSGRGISLLTNVAGDGNTITADGGPSTTGYVDGQLYQFKPNATNNGNVTLAVGSLPTISIKSNGNELRPEQIKQNIPVIVSFNEISNPDTFELVSPLPTRSTLSTQQNAIGTIEFSDVPAATNKITIIFNGVSLNPGGNILVQLGGAGGFETTGYVSTSMILPNGANPGAASLTTGFIVNLTDGNSIFSGHMLLTLIDPSTNNWVSSHLGKDANTSAMIGGGNKSLSQELTQIKILGTSSNVLDAGTINILFQ